MKLYLSSYRFGDAAEKLTAVFQNSRVALISNALDYSDDVSRLAQSAKRELSDLHSIDLDPEQLDLRQYFGKPEELKAKLNEFSGVWVRGGNTFVLRKAFRESGLDTILEELRSTNFVYAGYSVGACVLAPTLRGINLADEPEAVAVGYPSEVITEEIS